MSVSIMLSGNGELDSRKVGDLSVEAEKQGFNGLWFGETTLRDASVLATIAASVTKKIQIGTSIINVYTRAPGQLALLGATINELSGGRFWLGLGVSTAAIVQSYFGQHFDKPIKRLDETITLLHHYFSGERFSYQGEFYSPIGARLRTRPAPRIALAALNDQMIRKAAKVADRIILNLYPTDRIPHALNVIDEAASSGGRSKPILSVMLYADVVGDGERGLDTAKDLVSFYASAPAYSALFGSVGFASEATAMMDAWKTKDREAVKRVVTRPMIDRLMVLGTIEDVRDRVRIYQETGVDDVFIVPSPFADYERNINEIVHNYH